MIYSEINYSYVEASDIISGNYQETITFDKFLSDGSQLSSGQSIILYIFTEIIANIRFDSLILFDEPETHLHPNAISQLVNTIHKLVHEFESFCIITTHSPIVIQSLFAKNVFILERHEDIPSLRKIGLESLGENLSVLTEEVFGNKEAEKQYKVILDSLIDENRSFQETIARLRNQNIELSTNALLYLRSKTKA